MHIKTHEEIINSVITWNSDRYDRVYDEKFSRQLLIEEIRELHEAFEPVEALDAVGDMMFVCIGTLWKMGYDCDEICRFFNFVYRENSIPGKLELISKILFHLEITDHIPHIGFMFNTVFIHSFQIAKDIINLNKYNLYTILDIISISNHTKSIIRVSSTEKYSKPGKGANYVPPTKMLIDFLKSDRWKK